MRLLQLSFVAARPDGARELVAELHGVWTIFSSGVKLELLTIVMHDLGNTLIAESLLPHRNILFY